MRLYSSIGQSEPKGILVGEVWVCSGQSNMEMGVGMCKDGKQEIAAAEHPQIRLFLVAKKTSGQPVNDVEATWRPCTPNTGMAVITDIATLNDIHPPNKQDVGKRLALWALAKTYGKTEVVYSGPLYKSMKMEDGKIAVVFDHVGTGLATRDGKDVTDFEIAGADGKFVTAQAKIKGDRIIVSAEGISTPNQVRFAWDQLAQPNLINKEQLPASPFSSAELPQ